MRTNEAKWIDSRQRWQINVQLDGKRRTFTDSTPGRKGKISAERKADAWLNARTVGENTRCDVLLDSFCKQKELTTSHSNYRQVELYIRAYTKPIIGSKRISRITEQDLQDVIDRKYADGLAKKTLSNLRSTLVSFMKYCRKSGVSNLVPDDLVIPNGAKQGERKIVQPDGIKTLFSSDETLSRGKPSPDRLIHAYRFAVLTGLRPGELLGLRWSDVVGSKLHVNRSYNDLKETTTGKNDNARRTISLGGLALAELNAQRAMLSNEGIFSSSIFPDKYAETVSQRAYRDSWYRYCDHNKIPRVTPYELRHTYVSINDEMPDGLKKQAVGHSQSMDTEGVYGHKKAGDLERIAEYSDNSVKKIIGI